MESKELIAFRLVGGTGLSLQRGHRVSVDIDLFTDAEYDSIDFQKIENFLRNTWSYIDTSNTMPIGFGKSFFIGTAKDNCIKLDLYYTDPFFKDALLIDNIRLASIDDILAMKVDVICRGGRKKDFWDVHELFEDYSLQKMKDLHRARYPFTNNELLLIKQFTNFSNAEYDFDPICLRNKHWEIIKLDFLELIRSDSSL